jgi:hypothetical protein
MAFRRTTYRQAGCEGVVLDTSAIPRAHLVTCPADQHFFVRSDGRVAGCHPDCTTNKDCPSGSTCWAIGSAPGGPIDEPFCE